MQTLPLWLQISLATLCVTGAGVAWSEVVKWWAFKGRIVVDPETGERLP